MDSPSDLFGRQSSLISPFDPYLNPSTALDLPRHLTPSGRGHGAPYPGANPSSRPPYPLIHHLLQPGGAPMRSRGQLHLDQYHREEEGMGGGLVGVAGKRLSGALVADWSYDTTRVKRLRLESLVKGDGEIGLEEEKGRRSVQTGGREGRRREREELKEQLEEARGRLKALQEKVWKVFGQRSAQEEERRRSGREEEEDDDGDGGMDEEEVETAEGITEEDVEEEDLSLSFLPSTPPFQGIAKRDRKVRDHEKLRSEEQRNVNGGGGEGLSPCHLKKAKLMFFYARYPSSNTLKTYFPDVKFNRCVTSQLIKWFSNFREFFYIQMERFARQAAHDGLPRDGAPCLGRVSRETPLRLGRDTELYRILNMHYNKSNDYQVPDRFVEIAELALREFYTAIQTGRDSDPCWKKSIYKIICKLDSPVPDGFRLPGCPMG
ncbi:hypothetical protein J4Q44_G00053510 [Coregonus suidteri]|uniref:Prospero domain-containing protein n=1 Tax=Coregonus suidteri TaxID=861788 RepID=A0AAN8M9X7_9TELE